MTACFPEPLRAGVAALALACAAAAPALAAGGSGGGGGSGSRADSEVPGEVLVKLRSTADLLALQAKYSLTLLDQFGSRPIYRLATPAGVRTKDVVGPLSLEPAVLIAESNLVHSSPEARRNQPWAIGSASQYVAQWAPAAMNLAAAQQVSTGAGVRVAVLDTGVDASHPLLAGRVLPGFDFVDFDADPAEGGSSANGSWGHGTHVAGLVAMAAPGAQILPVRVLDPNGLGNAWVLAEAMLWALDPDGNPATDDGAHVINLSLGTLVRTRVMAAVANLATCGDAVPDDPIADRSDPGYAADEARCAGGHGAVVVAAAGNDGSSGVKEFPAAESAYGLLSVGASTSARRVASFSNAGSWVMVAAPGEGITSALPGGQWGTWSGTSMASPLAAGAAALLRSVYPGMAPKDVARRLSRASINLCGSALRQVDALAALTDNPPPDIACK